MVGLNPSQQRLQERIHELESFKLVQEQTAQLADSLEALGEHTEVLLQGSQGANLLS